MIFQLIFTGTRTSGEQLAGPSSLRSPKQTLQVDTRLLPPEILSLLRAFFCPNCLDLQSSQNTFLENFPSFSSNLSQKSAKLPETIGHLDRYRSLYHLHLWAYFIFEISMYDKSMQICYGQNPANQLRW